MTFWNHTQDVALRETIRKTDGIVVQPGEFIEEIVGIGPAGTRIQFRTLGVKHGSLVIGMSWQCGYCRQNLAPWRRLSEQARRLGLQVVWVSRDGLSSVRATESSPLDVNLVAEPTHSTFVRLKLGTVPQTLLLGQDGVVKTATVGVLDSHRLSELSRVLAQLAHGSE